MLFDTPATKPLWRYFHMRYGRYATHHVFGAEYDGTIRSSVGLNQGDPISSFLFAFFVSDLRVPSAVEVLQIHDDTYVVTTPDKVDSCLSELQEYYRGKQLRLRPQKTKILDGSMSTHVKIGGGYVHARGIPIPPETVEKFDFLPMLQQLPLQHSAYVLRQVVIPKWTSLLQSTDPRIVAPSLHMIREAQLGFVRRILKAANSDTIPFDEHQIWAPATLGGLGLFNPTPDSHEYVENSLCDTDRLAVNAVPKDSEWTHTLFASFSRSIASQTPVVTLGPLHPHLRVEDEAYAAFVSALLGTWTPRAMTCGLNGKLISGEASRQNSRIFIDHAIRCPSCSAGLKTLRHDLVADALSCALTANSIVYAAEPKAYPLRTKTSNGGKDGPDGMIFMRNHIAWLDFSIVHQEAADSHDNIKKGEIYKKNEYAPAEEVGIKVIPFVLSSFGAFGECAESLLKQLRDDFGAKVVRDIRNAIGAKLARSMALFLRHVDLEALRR